MPACPATGKTDMSDRMFLTLGEIIRVPHRLPASKATDKAVHYGDGRGNECCPNRSRRDRVHLDSVGREHLGQPAGPTSVSGGKSRLRKSEQVDKWSYCLTAGTLVPANQERR